MHGPGPRPGWVVTALGAVDADLGVLKTGKEADVHVVRRWVPGDPGRGVLMVAKRYRSREHRLFHRDAGYLEGRRVRESRQMRAMAKRTVFGKDLIRGQWATAEFETLGRLWGLGLPVPYPVQLDGDELLMELVTDAGGATDVAGGVGDRAGGVAAPRLVGARPPQEVLPQLFEQVRETMTTLARHGWAHGDLSPYNVLLSGERMVVIDWPQIVDIIGNPHGPEFLERDVRTMCGWFARRGHPVDEGELFGDLMGAAMSRW